MKIPMVEPSSRTVGAAPIFRHMADEIGMVSLMNRLLPWDPHQCRVSPGERILLLILDVLAGKTPLYRVSDRLVATDVAILVGAGRRPEDFTDDSLGRALDKLARAGPAKVFSALAMAAYTHENIGWGTMHWDSSSRSLEGNYASAVGAPVRPAYGYSKDHRPDLKQILMTLLVNREGVPLFGSIASGNQSDKTLNTAMIDQLAQALAPDALQQLIYVADSALVTGPNLSRLADAHLTFISRCPETFRVVTIVKSAAWAADDTWQPLGTVAHRTQAASYWASEQTGEIAERSYRLVVYRSNTLDQRRMRALDHEIATERQHLTRQAREFAAQSFACQADAQQALNRWQTEIHAQWHPVSGAVVARPHHTRPGRPRQTPLPTDTITTWHGEIQIEAIPSDRRQQELERRSTFVLMTTVPRERLSARDLLREYKDQSPVERHFHFLKDPLFVDALYVKKPERVEALGYVLLMACLLYSLIERRLRQAALPIPSPSRRVLTRPTGHEVVRHLQSLQILHDATGERVIALPTRLQPTLIAMLTALQMPATIFTKPCVRGGPD